MAGATGKSVEDCRGAPEHLRGDRLVRATVAKQLDETVSRAYGKLQGPHVLRTPEWTFYRTRKGSCRQSKGT